MGIKPNNINNIFIKRPKVKDYLNLKPEVKELVDYTVSQSLKANPILRKKGFLHTKKITAKQPDFWFLSWSDLVELREAVAEKNMTEALNIVFGIDENDFLSLEIFNAFAAYKWVVEQLTEIAKIESQELGHELTQDEKDAGVEALQEFGYTVAVDSLAKGNLLKYDSILKKPYAIIFRKMCLDKINNEIKKNLYENANRKSRGNL